MNAATAVIVHVEKHCPARILFFHAVYPIREASASLFHLESRAPEGFQQILNVLVSWSGFDHENIQE